MLTTESLTGTVGIEGPVCPDCGGELRQRSSRHGTWGWLHADQQPWVPAECAYACGAPKPSGLIYLEAVSLERAAITLVDETRQLKGCVTLADYLELKAKAHGAVGACQDAWRRYALALAEERGKGGAAA